MARNFVWETYRTFYVDMSMERRGLFDTIRRSYPCATVLYPGSLIHITPSFFFPHVVYVDTHETARKFFADSAGLLELVNTSKCYRRSAFVRFIAQDFTQPLPLMEQTFDLLIALYAGGIAQACKSYLKNGGLLLTNNHQDDAGKAAADREFELIAVINEAGAGYRIDRNQLTDYFVPKPAVTTRAHVRYARRKPEYTHNADYYLFRKIRPGR